MATDLLSTICREIDERLNELRPVLAERQRLLLAADALVETPVDGSELDRQPARKLAGSRAASASVKRSRHSARKSKPKSELTVQSNTKPERATRGAAREAILGALEHGSHTVGELAVVTAMSGPNINGNLRRLEDEGVVTKAEREGKVAWALIDATG